MISPLPGVTATKPGAAMTAAARRVTPRSSTTPASRCRTAPAATWCSPSRGRRCCATIWGDDERYKDTYWSRFQGVYFAGDGAKKDEDGDIWLLGRVDDVMNVSGHRISTTEVESALVSPPEGRRGGGRRRDRPDHRPGHRRVRHRPRRRRGRGPARRWSRNCATTWPRRSARSPSRGRSWSCPSCRRPGPARSCAGCCATSPSNRETRRRHHADRLLRDGPDQGEAAQRGERGLTRRAPSRRTGAGTRPCCSPRSCVRMRYFVLAA